MSPIRDLHEDRDVRTKAMLLGHVRLGIYDAQKHHPRQSETFVFTSADRQRLEPLVQDFGGGVERYEPQGAGEEPWRLVSNVDAFTALFPFADPAGNLAQSWELWSRSGIQRRCDGFDCDVMTVDDETGEILTEQRACICAATEERICAPTTRLRLLLPQTGLGIWELTTGSKVGAIELYDQVGFIATLASGRMNHLPIRVLYRPREISWFDPDKHKRFRTTKRVVHLSVAGDAERALAPLGMSADHGLIQAVRSALEDAGRTVALPAGDAARPALPTSSPAPPAKGEMSRAEHGTAEASGNQTPEASAGGDELATQEEWASAKAGGLSGAMVLRIVRKTHPDVKSVAEITSAQLAAVVRQREEAS